jgi:hypothetical protein
MRRWLRWSASSRAGSDGEGNAAGADAGSSALAEPPA